MNNKVSRLEQYHQWIVENYSTLSQAMGNCMEATDKMIERFPELRKARGQIILAGVLEETHHAWCVDEDGFIIDPTVKQYDGYYILAYDEFQHDHVALNNERYKCMNCGDYTYDTEDNTSRPFCSSICYSEYAKSIGLK